MNDKHPYKRRPVFHWAALFVFIFSGIGFGVWQLIVHPNTPLLPEWNPAQPLVVTEPVTLLTPWKLQRALKDGEACLAALETGAQADRQPDFSQSGQCGISPQVTLRGVGGTRLVAVNTRCQTALRLTMWAQHSLQPSTQEIFGQDLSQIEHFSGYSCRAIRTSSGESTRMSTHSTADAIDISGFVLADGRYAH